MARAGKFNPITGERFIDNTEGKPPLFQDVFGNTLLELAEANPRIVGVTPAMPSGCSMNILMAKMPERAFDVGIAEGHAVTFSGGMAKEGLQPFCNIYSSFMQRAYDNIIHDVAIQNLPVVLCLEPRRTGRRRRSHSPRRFRYGLPAPDTEPDNCLTDGRTRTAAADVHRAAPDKGRLPYATPEAGEHG